MSIYLKNTTDIDWKTLAFKKGHIQVTEGKNGAIQFIKKIPVHTKIAKEDRIIDCKNKLVTKAFGCGHHHIYSALSRGMPAPIVPPRILSKS